MGWIWKKERERWREREREKSKNLCDRAKNPFDTLYFTPSIFAFLLKPLQTRLYSRYFCTHTLCVYFLLSIHIYISMYIFYFIVFPLYSNAVHCFALFHIMFVFILFFSSNIFSKAWTYFEVCKCAAEIFRIWFVQAQTYESHTVFNI